VLSYTQVWDMQHATVHFYWYINKFVLFVCLSVTSQARPQWTWRRHLFPSVMALTNFWPHWIVLNSLRFMDSPTLLSKKFEQQALK